MDKTRAIELLGGSVAEAARRLGVSYQAVAKWPDVLSSRVADRVLGVCARSRLPDLSAPELTDAPTEQGVGNA